MVKCLLWIYSWVFLLIHATALYFYLDEGGEKCFFQELANETLLLGNYRCSAINGRNVKDEPHTEHGMLVEIKGPHKRIVFSRLYRHMGRFSYKSHEPGVHTICLYAKTEHSSEEKIKIEFDLQAGEHAINHSVNVKRTNLTLTEARYQELIEKAIEINKEMDYLRYREEMFRETTERISSRVLLWMIGETALLIIIGLWQIENLRRFFESKKLV